MIKVKIKLLSDKATIPQRAFDHDFCYDVYAVSEEEVLPNIWKYGLGFSLEISEDALDKIRDVKPCITLRPRSSIYKTGMVLSNGIGTIDYEYRGEVFAVFYHVMTNLPRYKVGDKIGQIHLDTSESIRFEDAVELNNTERGNCGYGSTDTTKEYTSKVDMEYLERKMASATPKWSGVDVDKYLADIRGYNDK